MEKTKYVYSEKTKTLVASNKKNLFFLPELIRHIREEQECRLWATSHHPTSVFDLIDGVESECKQIQFSVENLPRRVQAVMAAG